MLTIVRSSSVLVKLSSMFVPICSHFYARELAILAIARISYGNSVCPSVCLSVTTQYHLDSRWDRDYQWPWM